MSGTVEIPKVRESNGRISSSPGLSSPPTPSSPTHAKLTTQPPFLTHHHSYSQHGQYDANHAGAANLGETADAKNISAPVKKPRKKRDPTNTAAKRQAEAKNGTTSSSAIVDGKEIVVKHRKPRAAPGTSTRGRKPKATAIVHADIPAGQGKITDSLAPSQPPTHPLASATFAVSQNGRDEAIPIPPDSKYIPQYLTQPPTPRLSGQNYDPIRSSTVEARSIPPTPSNQHLRSPTPPRPVTYGSASNSPSISSLIDPPSHIHHPPLKRDSDATIPSSPPKKARLTPPEAILTQQVPEPPHRPSIPSNSFPTPNDAPTPMDVDGNTSGPVTVPTVRRKSATSTGTSTPAATKAARQKEAPVAISSGNGLLSSALFGGPSESTAAEKTAPTVVLDVPLNGENNKYVNFARLAEERYGFNALHPRLAAQRERLARVAAAGAALENAEKRAANGSGMSADDMSVDLSDGEAAGDDSNVEMGGISLIERDVLGSGRSPGDGSEGPAPPKRKKRMMKEDQYDKDDPFVDDTELAWEEQAAASKDGFFVYSGPLVPEGEKPNVERYMFHLPIPDSLTSRCSFRMHILVAIRLKVSYRAEGPPKRGRGSGRGRGSTRGSRGGGTRAAPGTRKPRVTKAAKLQMDQEKFQRESMAVLAAKPTTYPS